MFHDAFTRKVRVALKHMVRASSAFLSLFSTVLSLFLSLTFSPPRRRRINKIPQTRATGVYCATRGVKNGRKSDIPD